MTNRRTACLLLEHGRLSLAQFCEITGWDYGTCYRTLRDLRADGVIRAVRRGIYELVG